MTINSILEEIINLAKNILLLPLFFLVPVPKGLRQNEVILTSPYPVFQIQKIYWKSLIIYPLYTQ